jgi:hypothetical protein
MPIAVSDIARVSIEGVCENRVTVGVARTNYRIDLVDASRGAASKATPGRPINSIIRARALKMHRSTAGGTFIEPVEGSPRIVQGRILATDTARNEALVHAVVPMWIEVPAGQCASDFATGDLVNFYVESGATLTIA